MDEKQQLRRNQQAWDAQTRPHIESEFYDVGLDTLSWARLGANVTGVDFSAGSIAAATALAQELEIDARFVQANVYELPGELDEAFDLVVATYGVLMWLPDLDSWARAAARCLKPGGTLFSSSPHSGGQA